MTIKFKEALIDLDIPIYQAATSGESITYSVLDSDGVVLESNIRYKKEANNYIKDAEDFFEEDTSDWSIERNVEILDFDKCSSTLDSMVGSLIKKVGAEKGKFSIGGKTNFRDDLAKITKYKDRDYSNRPHHLTALKEYAINRYKPAISDYCESDDIISIWLYEDYLRGFNTKDKSLCERVMVDLEKDCRTTPGWHMNPKEDSEPIWISTLEANRWLFCMAIGGDSCDTYKGLKGYGYVKAKKHLEDCKNTKELYKKTLELFEDNLGKDVVLTKSWRGDNIQMTAKDIMIENLRLAFMLREGDWEEDWKKLIY